MSPLKAAILLSHTLSWFRQNLKSEHVASEKQDSVLLYNGEENQQFKKLNLKCRKR